MPKGEEVESVSIFNTTQVVYMFGRSFRSVIAKHRRVGGNLDRKKLKAEFASIVAERLGLKDKITEDDPNRLEVYSSIDFDLIITTFIDELGL